MAEGKNKIIVYADWKSTFDKLTDEEAGRLIKHFFAYVNDDDPEPVDRLTEIVFEPIKQTLKRDLKAWEETIGKKSFAGKVSAEKRRQQNSTLSTPVESVQHTTTDSTVSDNDSVSVTVSDSVIDNESNVLLEKEPKERNKRFDFKSALLSIGVSEKHANDWMDVRRKQKAANTETAFDEVYKQIKKSGFTPDEAVRIAAANSWRGLKADWLKNTMNNGTTNNNGTNSASDRLDDAKRNMAEQLTAAFGKQAVGEQGIPNNDFTGNGESDANTG